MTKKWRPFWSYDVEKTERWLSKMAAEGKRLVAVSTWTRMFSFEDAEREKVEYQIVYDKSQHELPRALEESDWENVLTEGNWKVIKNGITPIRAYPVRDGLLKRNRLHSIVLTVVAVLYGIQLVSFSFSMLGVILFPENVSIVSSPLWILTYLYFIQVVAVIILTVNMTRKLRVFERKYFSTAVDEVGTTGITFSKSKFIWTVAPDLLENWLSDMAAEGNHLVRVKGPRYIFEKGEPKDISYVYDYQLKATPSYCDIHKSAGWQLKSTMPQSFMKASLWMKEYGAGEKKPGFTYDRKEQRAQVRKVLLANFGSTILTLAVNLFVLWVGFGMNREDGLPLVTKIIFGLLVLSLLIPLSSIVRLLKYAYRIRKVSLL